jgi:hypothetical protein
LNTHHGEIIEIPSSSSYELSFLQRLALFTTRAEVLLQGSCQVLSVGVLWPGINNSVGAKYPRYYRSSVMTQNYGYDRFRPVANDNRTIHPVLEKRPHHSRLKRKGHQLKRINPENNLHHHFSTLRLARAAMISSSDCPSNLSRRPRKGTRVPGGMHLGASCKWISVADLEP